MAEITSESEEFCSARKERMSFTAEAVNTEITGLVRDIISGSSGETVKARLRSAARSLGLGVSRVADYYYGEVRRIEAHEADQIRYKAPIAQHEQMLRMHREYMAKRAKVASRTPWPLAPLLPPDVGEEEM
jgi:hypothetical protein